MSLDDRFQDAIEMVMTACRGLLEGYSERRWEYFDDSIHSLHVEHHRLTEVSPGDTWNGRMRSVAAMAARLYPKSESKIEAVMMGALTEAWAGRTGMMKSGYTIRQNVNIHPWRVDFLIARGSFEDRPFLPAMVIECDGKDFHAANALQIEKDKRRDRDLQARGLMVFRFSGSEIWADPTACAHQALSALERRLGDDFATPFMAFLKNYEGRREA